MKKLYPLFCFIFMVLSTVACKQGNTENTPAVGDTVSVPSFSADSAMAHIEGQCDFGERVLGTAAHDDCGRYIAEAFRAQGCEVTIQEAEFRLYNGSRHKGFNIIASTNPEASLRIMLCAHWDSRPWADNDPDPSNHKKPVPAANDGASGVAVMLEIARQIKLQAPVIGVDFVCFDAEDAGVPEWDTSFSGSVNDEEASWCLGSQYWAKNPHRRDFEFAVLLDMVGGRGATFYKEQFSMYYAPSVVARVWAAAAEAGYGSCFPDDQSGGGAITDDHLPLNRIAAIPSIDIIDYRPAQRPGFCPTWHTLDDTPQNIDPLTLKAVGQTLLQLIYTF